MKKLFFPAVFIVVLSFAACDLFNFNTPTTYSSQDLIGTWQENGTQKYVRFNNNERDSTNTYYYGYEWDEGQDTYPEDLVKHGDGWFKWTLVQSSLTEIQLMDNGGAKIPKVYTIVKLTDTDLEYKDDYNVKHSFSKVVSKK